MREGTCYVLEGACRFFVPKAIEIKAGQFAVIPAGDYEFEVLGDTEVVLVKAWKLPFAVPPPKKRLN
jgi:quercetin dioxygenase-like cupin family protein